MTNNRTGHFRSPIAGSTVVTRESAVMRVVIAFTAGAATVLAFAPFGIYVLGVAGPALLFWCWQGVTPRRALVLGFCFGLGLFGVGVSWVYVSLHVHGNMPVALAALTVAVLVALLAVFPAVVGWLQARLGAPRTVTLLCVTPALWALAEWVRSWFLTGFPWLSLGYGQVDGPLVGFAPWMGVYGVSWWVAVLAGLGVLAVGDRRPLRRGLWVGAALWIFLLGWLAGDWPWVQPRGAALKVALVQGNISLHDKWAPANGPRIVNNFLSLSAPHRDRDLIVWPESALPYELEDLPREFWDVIQDHPADFVFGIIETSDDGARIYNSVVSAATERQLYRKRHLVPFGEFLPLPRVLGGVIEHLDIPMANFDAWPAPQTSLAAAGIRIGVSICYEDAFPETVAESLPDAAVLVNVSEDAWFGDSLAPHQRLDMARMRSRETGRPMLRAANTGISAIIDHHGSVVTRSEQFVPTVVAGEVQPTLGVTPFVRFGSLPVIILCVTILAAVGATRLRWGARQA